MIICLFTLTTSYFISSHVTSRPLLVSLNQIPASGRKPLVMIDKLKHGLDIPQSDQTPLARPNSKSCTMMTSWKHFPHRWPFVRGIHRSPVDSPHNHHQIVRFKRKESLQEIISFNSISHLFKIFFLVDQRNHSQLRTPHFKYLHIYTMTYSLINPTASITVRKHKTQVELMEWHNVDVQYVCS